ncbi:DMT family transporter [Rhizobium sp. NRK18]|uniref:DMT family transporter n=1 Tax=Rhizobium sp. NRK18 TaxID=2964667 RepID=UPI0021C2ADF1|nr:DMT family transporter [Rhizobium sp. NRK18]MCQ2003680.1 DMT family transporter [Rhizobium sp. NRK18]
MPLSVFAVVLFAALLHASWNAIVKGGGNKVLTAVLVSAFSSVLAMVLLPFLPQPARESWPFIVASTCCQVVYYMMVARTYHVADMSQAYPLMRGTAPLIVALVSAFFVAEKLVPLEWVGIAVICCGILTMALNSRGNAQGAALALMNACVIATYTLIDGMGVRLSGAPAAYTLWVFLLTGIPLTLWAVLAYKAMFFDYLKRNWLGGLVGGIGTSTSYGLALWAMTIAPVAVVAALRETSILFGALISYFVLHEKVGRARIAAACVIAAGVMVLKAA